MIHNCPNPMPDKECNELLQKLQSMKPSQKRDLLSIIHKLKAKKPGTEEHQQ